MELRHVRQVELLLVSLALALMFEGLFWRTPTSFRTDQSRLFKQCAGVTSGMDQVSAVSVFTDYETARKTDGSNPQLIYQLGKAQCTIRFDEHSGRVVQAHGSVVASEFSPEERFH